MVRRRQRRSSGGVSCPHARGDGPPLLPARKTPIELSPRAWGWSVTPDMFARFHLVVPTRVGMVRPPHRPPPPRPRCPHARGDGPRGLLDVSEMDKLSPRAWGWSEVEDTLIAPHDVVPTRVGMVRSTRLTRRRTSSCPHARGDGPLGEAVTLLAAPLSPRAWGWSAGGERPLRRLHVVPTRVGMVRTSRRGRWAAGRCPHARGDGPACQMICCPNFKLSPRAWGWSAASRSVMPLISVVPTRVGMVRRRAMR